MKLKFEREREKNLRAGGVDLGENVYGETAEMGLGEENCLENF